MSGITTAKSPQLPNPEPLPQGDLGPIMGALTRSCDPDSIVQAIGQVEKLVDSDTFRALSTDAPERRHAHDHILELRIALRSHPNEKTLMRTLDQLEALVGIAA